MTQFLRLFPEFRALEAKLQDSESRLIKAQDEARYWNGYAERSNELVDEMRVMQGISVDPETAYTPDPSLPLKRSARDVQREAVTKSRKDALDRRRAHESKQMELFN